MLAVWLLGATGAAAQTEAAPTQAAQPAPAAMLTPAEAQRALDVLTDDGRRNEIIDVLRAVAAAAPPEPVPAEATPAPALPATIERDGLVSQVLTNLGIAVDVVIDRTVALVTPLAGLPYAWSWLIYTLADAGTQALVFDAAWKVAAAVGAALLAEWLTHRALARPRRALTAAASSGLQLEAGPQVRATVGRRCTLAAAGFALDMLPLAAFALVGVTLAAVGTLVLAMASEQQPTSRLIVMVAINAHLAWGVLTSLAYRLTSPDIHRLRPLPLDDADATYAYRTARRLLTLVIYALAGLEVARVLGIGSYAYGALLKLIMLVTHAMIIMVVLHCRRGVAERIRGRPPRPGTFGMLRGWIAAVWHLAAIFFLLALWLVWAADVRDGYLLMLRYFFSTAIVLLLAQFLSVVMLKGLDRAFSLQARDFGRFSMVQERASRYYPAIRRLIQVAGGVLTVLVLLQVWGVAVVDWFGNEQGIGNQLLSAAIIVAIAGALALILWEGVNAAVERHLDQLGHRGDRARAARLRTLLPLLRTSLLAFVVGVVGLTMLSELGINIAPLLAGAGIVGVAIGFGSQKLVQDVITGVFLLLENVMSVGDWVTVAGLSGAVENLSIRTIRLRAGDGSVHVVPFSSVTTVTNTNRGIGNAAISVTVAYAEDTDRVGEVLKSVGAELRRDPDFATSILDDLALWGVDKVGGDGVTILGQIRCLDSGRWGVQREFNRRMKKRFQELGIEVADPNRRTYVSPAPEDALVRGGGAEPAGPTSATETRSPPPAALGHEA